MTDPARRGPGQPLDSTSDADLAVAAREGSPDACTELVRRFERPIYNLVARLVQDPAMAEDLTQEAFLKMFRALDRFDADLRFSSWLFRIAHYTAIDYLRQRRLLVASPRLDDKEEEVDPLASLPDLSGGFAPSMRFSPVPGRRRPLDAPIRHPCGPELPRRVILAVVHPRWNFQLPY